MSKLQIGDKILITHILKRSYDGQRRVWVAKELEKSRVVVYIGHRTLSDGHVDFETGEYTPSNYYRAALVVLDETRNPVYTSWGAAVNGKLKEGA